jgi:hypothetical protein
MNGHALVKIDLDGLSKPANTLIKKMSEAVGGIARPAQIRRVAEAEADAERIKTLSRIETTELEQRALQRFVFEEAKKQNNIESITGQSLLQLNESAKPEEIEDDWITNFFDKCRLISDEEMQSIWANILAGEANTPGRFSKRTVNFMVSLDKKDAQLFTKLCAFNWRVGNIQPLIYDPNAEIYTRNGINFVGLKHLDAIGLISFESGITRYQREHFPETTIAAYKNDLYLLKFTKEKDNNIDVGQVLFTGIGEELASICTPEIVTGFDEYIIDHWKKQSIEVVSLAGPTKSSP